MWAELLERLSCGKNRQLRAWSLGPCGSWVHGIGPSHPLPGPCLFAPCVEGACFLALGTVGLHIPWALLPLPSHPRGFESCLQVIQLGLHIQEALCALAPLSTRFLGVSTWTGLMGLRTSSVGFPHCDDACLTHPQLTDKCQ